MNKRSKILLVTLLIVVIFTLFLVIWNQFKNNKATKYKYTISHDGDKYLAETNWENDKKGSITLYYPDGEINSRAMAHKQNRQGKAKSWYKNGNLQSTGQFDKNRKTGIWKYYYPSGELKKEKTYLNGILHGELKEYSKSGKIESIELYKGGLEHGTYSYYHKNEKLRLVSNYKNGKLNGEETYYSTDGISPLISSVYKMGIKIIDKDYHENGKVSGIVEYDNTGKFRILQKEYHKNGNLRQVKPYAKDKLDGALIKYFLSGKKQLITNYKTGEKHGLCKEFYPNDQLKREFRYEKGKIVGVWEWYKSGEPKFKQVFDKGKIINITHFPTPSLPIYNVTNTRELVNALGDFRRIILKKGIYDIGADKELSSKIQNLNNYTALTLEGEKSGEVSIVVTDPQAIVMTIHGGYGLTLKNLSIGHEVAPQENCISGVMWIKYSQNMTIDNCRLYGTGTIGLILTNVNDLTVNDSIIDECSERLLELDECKSIHFQNTAFKQTGGSWLIRLYMSKNIIFNDCLFYENWSEDFLFYLSESKNILVENSKISNNLTPKLCNTPNELQFTKTIIKNNEFLAPGESIDQQLKKLLKCIENGEVSESLKIAQSGVDLNSLQLIPPLMKAVSLYDRVDANIVKGLLDLGAKPNLIVKDPPESGESPFQALKKSILHILCKHNANDFDNPAMAADNYLKAAKHLIDYGAKVNARDSYNYTPLHYAASTGFLQMAKSLIISGADLNYQSRTWAGGDTPLFISLTANHHKVAELLIKNGADVNLPSYSGETPLHLIVYPHKTEAFGKSLSLQIRLKLTELLLKHGADLNLKNKEGITPYQIAKKSDEQEMLDLLEQYIKNNNLKDIK